MKRHASFEVASNDGFLDLDDFTSTNRSSISSTATAALTTQTTIKSAKKICLRNRIGSYILGPKLNGLSSNPSIAHYLCRKDKTDQFFIIKVNI